MTVDRYPLSFVVLLKMEGLDDLGPHPHHSSRNIRYPYAGRHPSLDLGLTALVSLRERRAPL